MASDLSPIIQEVLTNTIQTTIGKETKITSIFNISKDYLYNTNLICVETSFNYESLISNLKIIVPAYTASFIFNSMMMEEGPLVEDFSDDISDAIKEIVSQISGAMETTINAQAYEDLGQTKFLMGSFDIIEGDKYQVVNSLTLFKLNIEDQPFELFIDFDEETIPFIDEIKQSDSLKSKVNDPLATDDELNELLATDDEIEQNDNKPPTIDDENNSTNDTPEEINAINKQSTESKVDESNNDISEDENIETTNNTIENSNITDELNSLEETQEINESTETENHEEENPKESSQKDTDTNNIDEDKKNKKLKIIVYIISGILGFLVIGFLIAYFMGIFEPPTPPKQETNITKETQKSMIMIDIIDKDIEYKNSMINEKRLNKRLSLLTKYEILEEDLIEKSKLMKKEHLHKLRMKRLEEFAKENKEESLFKKDLNRSLPKLDRFTSSEKNSSYQNKIAIENEKLTYIKIVPLKYKRYKDIIANKKSKSTSISICKNNLGKIFVYIGPIFTNTELNKISNSMNSKNNRTLDLISLTQKEFNTMCNF